jgi:hypothetical protein
MRTVGKRVGKERADPLAGDGIDCQFGPSGPREGESDRGGRIEGIGGVAQDGQGPGMSGVFGHSGRCRMEPPEAVAFRAGHGISPPHPDIPARIHGQCGYMLIFIDSLKRIRAPGPVIVPHQRPIRTEPFLTGTTDSDFLNPSDRSGNVGPEKSDFLSIIPSYSAISAIINHGHPEVVIRIDTYGIGLRNIVIIIEIIRDIPLFLFFKKNKIGSRRWRRALPGGRTYESCCWTRPSSETTTRRQTKSRCGCTTTCAA